MGKERECETRCRAGRKENREAPRGEKGKGGLRRTPFRCQSLLMKEEMILFWKTNRLNKYLSCEHPLTQITVSQAFS